MKGGDLIFNLNKKQGILILLSFFLLIASLTSCQSTTVDGLENSLQLAEENINRLEKENKSLNEELNNLSKELKDYRKSMLDYEKLEEKREEAIATLKNLQFIDKEISYLDDLKKACSPSAIDSVLKEAKDSNSKNKTEFIQASKEKITSLDFLSGEEKDSFYNKINSISEKEEGKNYLKEAEELNQSNKVKAKEETKKVTSQISQENSSGTSNQKVDENSSQVLVTPTGKKYHLRKCGNGNYSPTSLSKAKARGLTACKKCF